tara:strand:+ start:943 stop:1260 length:318 start_codon:yes stop_codon:yes gene_type:complete
MNNLENYAKDLINKKINYRKIIIKEPNYIDNLIKTTLNTEITNQKSKIRSIKKNILEQQKYLLEEDIKLKSLLKKQNEVEFKNKKIKIINETRNKTNIDHKTLNF